MQLRNTYTALVTPFREGEIDFESFEKLCDFQASNGCGILANGTTAETPTLTEFEQGELLERVLSFDANAIAGTGSNCTDKTIERTRHATELGAQTCLLVDAYYNGPSSQELRTEYYEPIAQAFPETGFIPYVIPSRTGCELAVEDLAILAEENTNIIGVKEATGSLERMAKTRCILPEIPIFSGDDDKTFSMLTNPQISAQGVISVVSNLLPNAVSEMVNAHHDANALQARQLSEALSSLFGIVVVKTPEQTRFGQVTQKWRNPLPIKTAMAGLGLIESGCRRPLGRMSENGVEAVRLAVESAFNAMPEMFDPMQEFFEVDVQDKLASDWKWLSAQSRVAATVVA